MDKHYMKMYNKLTQYEKGLRNVAENALKCKIPTIPGNINSIGEINFLERILHFNEFGNLEHDYYKNNHGDELTKILSRLSKGELNDAKK